MQKALKFTFGIHAVVALVLGLPLLVIPGRFLGIFGWAPVDPHLSRLFGAALLALGWSSFLGFRSTDTKLQNAFIQVEIVYCVLGAVGLLRHLAVAWYPWYVWTVFALLVAFAIAWLFFFYKMRRSD